MSGQAMGLAQVRDALLTEVERRTDRLEPGAIVLAHSVVGEDRREIDHASYVLGGTADLPCRSRQLAAIAEAVLWSLEDDCRSIMDPGSALGVACLLRQAQTLIGAWAEANCQVVNRT